VTRGARISAGLFLGFLLAFVATAPWHIQSWEVGRLSAALAADLVIIGGSLFLPSVRASLLDLLRRGCPRLSRQSVLFAGLAVTGFLLRVVTNRFLALKVNAWDFSIVDRALARPHTGDVLYSDILRQSYFGVHASYLLFAFMPLYRVVASPVWLLLAQAGAIAAGTIMAFYVFRIIVEDELAAVFLAIGFLLNAYTAKAAQYVFHQEVFYPVAVFTLLWAFLRSRPAAFGLALLLLLTIKEDAFLVTLGFALAAWHFYRRPLWGAVAAAAGVVFAWIALWRVLPAYSQSAQPSYSWYWHSFGATPLQAMLGMLTNPGRFLGALGHSGAAGVLETLLFLPVAGPAWLVASMPALLPFAVSDLKQLAHFGLYYSMPILPFLFAATAAGVRRLGLYRNGSPLRVRVLALAVMLVCSLDGGGYTFDRARPERREITTLLATVPSRLIVRVQGSLLPHVGYAESYEVLDATPIKPSEAVLLDPTGDPFPFDRKALQEMVRQLGRTGRKVVHSQHGLLLFRSGAGE